MSRVRAALAGQTATLAICLTYALYVGPVGFFWDSHTLVDRARHLAERGTLDINNHPTSIAPPLYSVLISPALLNTDPGAALRWIVAINAILLSISFLPLYAWLRSYSRLPPNWAAAWAVAVSVAPFALTYAPFLMTEAAYYPIFYACCLAFSRAEARPTLARFALVGVSIGAAALTRDAARALLLAAAPIAAIRVLALWKSPRSALIVAIRYAVLAGATIGILASWGWFQQHFVRFNRGTGSLWSGVVAMFGDATDLQLHAVWLLNCGAYLLLAPLAPAALLVIGAAVARPRLIPQDSTAAWLLLAILISAVVAVLLMPGAWGGPELTWNRYVAPFVGVWFAILLRHRRRITATPAIVGGLVAAGLALLGNPARLDCHFPDSLTPLLTRLNPGAPPAWINAAVAAALVVGCLLMWRLGRRGHVVVLVMLAASSAWVGRENARNWRRNVHNLGNGQGVGPLLNGALRTDPEALAFFDPKASDTDVFALGRALLYVDRSIPPMNRVSLYRAATERRFDRTVYYLSDFALPDARVLGCDRDAIFLSALPPLTGSIAPGVTDSELRELLVTPAPPPRFTASTVEGAATRAIQRGERVHFEPYGDGFAIWMASGASGGITLYIESHRATHATLELDIALIGPSAPQPCPIDLLRLPPIGAASTPGSSPPAHPATGASAELTRADEDGSPSAGTPRLVHRANVTEAGVIPCPLELPIGLTRLHVHLPVAAGPGRAGDDPRELMLLLRGVRLTP
ncbi:MAG: hypothetical protein HRU75_07310 [Planctomycetia bacterium]|nr:MAG: hypothetical protein HRU75_07310 [Planctomycetia bacterium]